MSDTKVVMADLTGLRDSLAERRIEAALALARQEISLRELILVHEAIVAVEAAMKDASDERPIARNRSKRSVG